MRAMRVDEIEFKTLSSTRMSDLYNSYTGLYVLKTVYVTEDAVFYKMELRLLIDFSFVY